MFKKILLPSDGSEASLRTARQVGAHFASAQDTQITVVVVTQPLDTQNTDFDADFVKAHNIHLRRQAECALEKTTHVLAELDVTCTGKILEGDPVSAILACEAKAGAYDLIAISSRGLAAQKDKLHYMGNVTEHVIRRVHIPVLVYPVVE